MGNPLKFFKKDKPIQPQSNPWGEESTEGSSTQMYSFPNSIQVAMQFVFAAINKNLPQHIQEHIRFDESYLPKELRLYKIFSNFGIHGHGNGTDRYRDRTLYFSFTKECHDEGCLSIYLRKYASGTWKVVSMTYVRRYTGEGSPIGSHSLERYEVVVEPHVENEGTAHAFFTESGFRISSY